MEVWKDIPNTESYYQVSSNGRVRSYKSAKCVYLKPSFTNRGYGRVRVRVNNTYQTYFLHRLLFDLFVQAIPMGAEVDHINTDKKDNRLENLRLATRQQQTFNRNKRRNSTSKFKGVSRTKQGRWKVEICVNGDKRYLGVFGTEEEAALAYNKAATEHFGEYAKINEVII